MTWEYFYDRYDNWSEATLKQRISVLETAGLVLREHDDATGAVGKAFKHQ